MDSATTLENGSRERATTDRWMLLGINAIGGMAVLASYAWGFMAQPDAFGALWGGVPEAIRPLYTVNMLLAATGYFFFTTYFAARLPADFKIGGLPGTRLVTLLYVLVLLPSALWLPLTVEMVAAPSVALWWTIRVTLALVGIGSLGLLAAAIAASPRAGGRTMAIVGAIPFCVQTALLDATIWPVYFPAP